MGRRTKGAIHGDMKGVSKAFQQLGLYLIQKATCFLYLFHDLFLCRRLYHFLFNIWKGPIVSNALYSGHLAIVWPRREVVKRGFRFVGSRLAATAKCLHRVTVLTKLNLTFLSAMCLITDYRQKVSNFSKSSSWASVLPGLSVKLLHSESVWGGGGGIIILMINVFKI